MNTFSAIAEPTRRNIIELLASSGQLSSSDISDKFKVSPPAISQHLKVLREAKLVYMEKVAQRRIYSINPAKLSEIEEWTKKMRIRWEKKFLRLDTLLENQEKGGKTWIIKG